MKNSRTALNGRSAFSIVLKNGVSVVALGALAAALTVPAFAQDAAPAETDVTEVVVTGQRAQIKTAQKLKRDAESVVDSITATDIGALPDRSVSEALQRVAGITLQRTDANRDPARLSGEGGAIFVRGLSYVSTLLNGREVFSAKSGRSIGFEDVSADLMAGVDVYKSTVSEQIEGALGGTVNLRTRLPFDSKNRIIGFTADTNYGDLREESFQSGSITYSDRWETGIGEVGLLLNYSLSNIGTRSNAFTTDRFDNVTGSTTRFVPKAMGFRTIDWEQKREAYAGALQWRPNDDMEFTLQYLNTKATPKSLEHSTGISDNILTPNSTYAYDANGQFTGGVINNTVHRNVTRSGVDNKETSDIALSAKYYLSDKLTLSGEIQRVESTSKVVSFTVGTELMDQVDVAVDLYGGELPKFTYYNNGYYNGTAVTANTALATTNDPTRYLYNFAMDHLEDNEAEQNAARVDVDYSFDSDWLKSFKAGVRFAEKSTITRENGYNWGAVSQDAAWNGNHINNDPPISGMNELYTYENFFHGDSPSPVTGWFPSEMLANYAASKDKIAQAAGDLGWGWVPFSGDFAAVGPGRADNPTSGIIEQSEETKAVYGVLRFAKDDIFGSDKTVDGNVGVRIVKTELSNGNGLLGNPGALANTTAQNINPNSSAALRAEINNAFAITAVGGTVTGIALENSYTDVLPSLNARLLWSDQLQFRVSLSKAIVRPSFGQMQPYTTLAVTADLVESGITIPNPQNPTGPGIPLQYITSIEYTGSGGNPDLQPMRANAYDFSAEWYFAPTGSLTFAAFHKDLTDYFFGATAAETYTVGGITKDYDVFRTRNGDEGTIDGFELAYSQFYDFLPGPLSGFGIQANYTKVKSDGGSNTVTNVTDPNQVAGGQSEALPLEGLSEDSYNIAVMYEKYGLSARLAYNWRSEYLLTTSAANINAPVWAEDYGQLDGSVLYSVTKNVKVGLQATNLLKKKTYLKVGYPDRLNRYAWFDTDQRIAFVVRGQF